MIIPSDQQIYERWGTLPDSLKDALTAEDTEQFVREFAAAKDLDDDDIDGVEATIGYVLLGFLGADEFAGELTERLGLDPDDAAALQKAINDKIFAPHKKELDAAYKPADEISPSATLGAPPAAAGMAAPRMLDITSPKAVPPPMPAPASIPTGPLPPKPPSTPQSLSGKGWSGTRADMPPIAPTPTPTSAAAPAPAAPKAPVPPPAPVMLQKETAPFQPPKNIDFHLPSKESAKMEFNMQTQPKAIPAVIEFGKVASPQPAMPRPPMPAPGQGSTPHNGETKPPFASFSLAQQGRTVTEITADAAPNTIQKAAPAPAPVPPATQAPLPSSSIISNIPKPPAPPQALKSVMASVPKPSTPPPPPPPSAQPPQPKVIVKNFTQ